MTVPFKPDSRTWRRCRGSLHRFVIDSSDLCHPSAPAVVLIAHNAYGPSARRLSMRSRQFQANATMPGAARRIGHRKSNHHFQPMKHSPRFSGEQYITAGGGRATRRRSCPMI